MILGVAVCASAENATDAQVSAPTETTATTAAAALTSDASAATSAVVTASTATTTAANGLCVVIMGDSRTVAIMAVLNDDKSFKRTYYEPDTLGGCAVYTKDNIKILVAAEAGGYYKNGAYERVINKIKTQLLINTEVNNCQSYQFFNLFGFNDYWNDKSSSGAIYLSRDEMLIREVARCDAFYQFNAGPVDEQGEVYLNEFTNEDLRKYNNTFVNTSHVAVVDLQSYLESAGYAGTYNASDLSGVHYDTATNKKILNFILSIAFPYVYGNASATAGTTTSATTGLAANAQATASTQASGLTTQAAASLTSSDAHAVTDPETSAALAPQGANSSVIAIGRLLYYNLNTVH